MTISHSSFTIQTGPSGRSILAYLTGDGSDGCGSGLDDLLDSEDTVLERRHDYIQWLFPLTDPSRAVPDSPFLTAADVTDIRASGRARANLLAAAERMKTFYARTGHWRAGSDHNHLRITRIIRSLRLLTSDAAADGFKAHILALINDDPHRIPATTREFWRTA